MSPELNARPYNIIEILKKVMGRAALFPGDIADEYYAVSYTHLTLPTRKLV